MAALQKQKRAPPCCFHLAIFAALQKRALPRCCALADAAAGAPPGRCGFLSTERGGACASAALAVV
jgi:hypothetical protein